jgi:hypothetical protein
MALKIFRKPNDIDAARADIDRKARLLADAEGLLAERKAAAQKSAEAGAGDEDLRPLVTAEQEAEKLVELRSHALNDARAHLRTLEAEAAKIAEQRQREETAVEIEQRALELEAAGTVYDAAMIRLVAAAEKGLEVTLDCGGILTFASSARLEMPPAIAMAAQVMRDRARATVAGNAPAIIAVTPPVLLPPPKPPLPTVSAFALRHVAWTDHNGMLRSASAMTGNIELPEAAAARGLKSGAVCRMNDPRVKKLATSRAVRFVPDPARCEMLDDTVVPPSGSTAIHHSAFPLPPGEAFEPLDRGPPRTITVPRGDVADQLAATRSADDVEEQ